MLVVACSGFPIAVSRYLSEFRAVEIADTEIGIPGMGSIRLAARGAEGFCSKCRPAAIGGTCRAERRGDQALKDPLVREEADAPAIVFRVPDEVPGGRSRRARRSCSPGFLLGPLPRSSTPHWPGAIRRSLRVGGRGRCDGSTVRRGLREAAYSRCRPCRPSLAPRRGDARDRRGPALLDQQRDDDVRVPQHRHGRNAKSLKGVAAKKPVARARRDGARSDQSRRAARRLRRARLPLRDRPRSYRPRRDRQ
jgi:hypothetical protein